MPSNAQRLRDLVDRNDLVALQEQFDKKRAVFSHRDDQGHRVLHWACQQRVGLDTLRLLLTHATKEDVNRMSSDRLTPLIVATRSGQVEHLKALLKKGARPSAIAADRVHVPNPLLEVVEVPSGTAALHQAGTPELVDLLVNAGAAIEQRDSSGLTPLLRAVMDHRVDVVEALIKHGADPHAVGVNLPGRATWLGYSALHLAMTRPGLASLVERFLDLGVDPHRPLPNGKTPLDLARDHLPKAPLSGNVAAMERWLLTQEARGEPATGRRPERVRL